MRWVLTQRLCRNKELERFGGHHASRSCECRRLLNQLFVKANGPSSDYGPAEGFLGSPPSRIPETPALLRILKESIDSGSKIPRKLFGMKRKTCDKILIEGNQVARFSVDDDLFDASCGTSDDGGTARHRLEVDDAEGLVD